MMRIKSGKFLFIDEFYGIGKRLAKVLPATVQYLMKGNTTKEGSFKVLEEILVGRSFRVN